MENKINASGRFPFADEVPAMIRETLKTFSNIKLMQQKKKEADKAKKILFGTKNIGGDPLWNAEGVCRDNPEAKMNADAIQRKKMDYLNDLGPNPGQLVASEKPDEDFPEKYRKQGYNNFDELIGKAMNFFLNGGDDLLTYCVENKIWVQDLIEAHKNWKRFQEHKAFKEQLKNDIDEYDETHRDK